MSKAKKRVTGIGGIFLNQEIPKKSKAGIKSIWGLTLTPMALVLSGGRPMMPVKKDLANGAHSMNQQSTSVRQKRVL